MQLVHCFQFVQFASSVTTGGNRQVHSMHLMHKPSQKLRIRLPTFQSSHLSGVAQLGGVAKKESEKNVDFISSNSCVEQDLITSKLSKLKSLSNLPNLEVRAPCTCIREAIQIKTFSLRKNS